MRGLALVGGREAVTEEDIERIVRVGLDCIPAVRLVALRALAEGDEDLTTTALARQVQYSTSAARRALEDLQSLELVACNKGGSGVADRWSLREKWRAKVATFSEVSERASSCERMARGGLGFDDEGSPS